MRILVCGGRDFDDYELLKKTLTEQAEGQEDPIIIIHGGAPGADSIADLVAKRKLKWWVWCCRANWLRHGKAAGVIRNQQMLENSNPDLVIAFPTKQSKGTWDMVQRAKNANIPTLVIEQKEEYEA